MPRSKDPALDLTMKTGTGHKLPATKKAAIVSALASGMSVKEAAVFNEVSPNTVYGLLNDDQFRELLQTAEDVAVNTILQEVQNNVRNSVKALGPKALDALTEALDSEDSRVKLQAAGMVLRGTGIMDGGKELNIRVGLEGIVGNDSPASGD